MHCIYQEFRLFIIFLCSIPSYYTTFYFFVGTSLILYLVI